jgi:hypothetical protein
MTGRAHADAAWPGPMLSGLIFESLADERRQRCAALGGNLSQALKELLGGGDGRALHSDIMARRPAHARAWLPRKRGSPAPTSGTPRRLAALLSMSIGIVIISAESSRRARSGDTEGR